MSELTISTRVAMLENGWMDDFLCKEWFRKSFIPQATAQNTSGKPILLIYDGHRSHDTLNLIELAWEHNVILFCLPPHTTHKLQPFDVGVFEHFSQIQVKRCHVSILSRNTWMCGTNNSKNQLFRQLGGKAAVGQLTRWYSKMRTTHQTFQHQHPHPMFWTLFPLIDPTSMTIYQTWMKMRIVAQCQVLSQILMMTPNFHSPVLRAPQWSSITNMSQHQSQWDLFWLTHQHYKLSQLPHFIHKCIPTTEALAFMIKFTN